MSYLDRSAIYDASATFTPRAGDVRLDLDSNLSDNNVPQNSVSSAGARGGGSWIRTLHHDAPDSIGVAGLKYVLLPKGHPIRKFGWSIILACAIAALTFHIINRCLYFASYPLVVSIVIDHTVTEIQFPKVVICNFNSYVKSKAQNFSLLDTYLKGSNLNVFQPNLNTIIPMTPEVYEKFQEMNYSQMLLDLAHQPENMFISISFGDEVLSIANVTPLFTNFGLCYQLNDGQDGRDLLKTTHTGRNSGLKMILNTQQDEYYLGQTGRYDAGFVIQLLPQDEESFVSELGFTVAPGTGNFVALGLAVEENLKPPHGICGERTLKYYGSYSLRKCQTECITDYIVKECGCKAAFLPGNFTVCNPIEEVYCIKPNLDAAYKQAGSCKCPVNCRNEIFPFTLSSSTYPSEFWSRELWKFIDSEAENIPENHLNPTYLTNNIVAVNIFFSTLYPTYTIQKASYSILTLLCDVGGAMGLWLGGSLLTIYEVLDLCGYSYLSARRNSRR